MRKFQCLFFVLNLLEFADTICMVAPLNTQHVSKTQTPHVLIICILKKDNVFLVHLLSRLGFLATIV